MIKTLKIRIRPTSGVVKFLDSYVEPVNVLWNFLTDTVVEDLTTRGFYSDYTYQRRSSKNNTTYKTHIHKNSKYINELPKNRSIITVSNTTDFHNGAIFMSNYDFEKLLRGVSKDFGIVGTGIIGEVCAEFSARLKKNIEKYNSLPNYKKKNRKLAIQMNTKQHSSSDHFLSRLSRDAKDCRLVSESVHSPNYNNHKNVQKSVMKSINKVKGWVPFKGVDLKIVDGKHVFFGSKKTGKTLVLLEDIHKLARKLGSEDYTFGAGNFARDASGRWFLNISVKFTPVKKRRSTGLKAGIDSGFSTTLTVSDGDKYMVPLEKLKKIDEKIASIQKTEKSKSKLEKNITSNMRISRDGNKKDRRIAKLYIQSNNIKKDFIHKTSNILLKKYDEIAFGKLSLKGLQKKFGKSVKYHSIGDIKTKLEYKACQFAENTPVVAQASERGSTITCFECGGVHGPKGFNNLGVREWDCPACGTKSIDRDVNAAKNILFNFDSKRGVGVKRNKELKGLLLMNDTK